MSEAATQNNLKISLVTPEGSLFEDVAGFVAVPGYDGEIGILPHHTALIARLGIGPLRIVEGNLGGEVALRFAVRGGFLQVLEGKVLILAAEAVKPEDIVEASLSEERDEILEALKNPESDEAYTGLLERRRWLETREGVLRAAG